MRKILFRGKRADNCEWVEGGILQTENWASIYVCKDYQGSMNEPPCCEVEEYEVIPETVGQYTGLTDKNGKKIFEGDIVQYQTYDGFICTSVVKLSKYKQDGSGGEYNGIDCIGYYVAVIEFICPDWCDEDFCFFHEHLKAQNILEVVKECEVIGNIYDNPELLEVSK